ncbi:MAG: hypothetical protein AB8B56_09645 [Crocinitomicaceae bacterium]
MKKLIIPIVLFLLSYSADAQSWDAKLENAQFQTRVHNHLAFSSEISKNQGIFTDEDFDLVSDRCLTKEGVFKLELSDDKSSIKVYFLDWIDQWTINWLFIEGNSEFEGKLRINQKIKFTF